MCICVYMCMYVYIYIYIYIYIYVCIYKGLLPELLALWRVSVRSNRFEYITAAKAR